MLKHPSPGTVQFREGSLTALSSREIAPALCPQPGPGAGSMGDWRGGDTELSSLLRRLYTSRTNLFSDVTIVCADSKLVAAHKLVLAVTSQYFQAHL